MTRDRNAIPCLDETCPGQLRQVTHVTRYQSVRMNEVGGLVVPAGVYPGETWETHECDLCMEPVEDLPAWLVVLAGRSRPEPPEPVSPAPALLILEVELG